MKLTTFLVTLITTMPLTFAIHFSTTTSNTSTSATCGAPDDSICAQFLFPNGAVSQDIRLDDGGCTDVAYPNEVSGIKVYDCWCGLWNAQDSGACNNGDDTVVDQIDSCAGEVDGKGRWKGVPTHVSCFRL